MPKKIKLITSPLRYPGGKSKAIKQIIQYLPANFSEYREPFIGGGSVFIYLKQKFPDLKIWINDLNPELYLFWKFAQSDLEQLVEEVSRIKSNYSNGKKLFEELTQVDVEKISDFERAVRFFVLNRITFSGTVESGGFSQEAFQTRFADSSIKRLKDIKPILQDIKITNLDYSEVLDAQEESSAVQRRNLNSVGEDVFIFLDPPYFCATKSKLYGKDGNLHTAFNHQRFADILKDCQHQWLITYDNSPEIRGNFNFAHIFEWELQYGMNNYKQSSAAKGKELFISNYEVNFDSKKQQIEKTTSANISQQLSLKLFS